MEKVCCTQSEPDKTKAVEEVQRMLWFEALKSTSRIPRGLLPVFLNQALIPVTPAAVKFPVQSVLLLSVAKLPPLALISSALLEDCPPETLVGADPPAHDWVVPSSKSLKLESEIALAEPTKVRIEKARSGREKFMEGFLDKV
jgi:hypothetical protein